MQLTKELSTFAMLPPFYDKPKHTEVTWYLKRIEEEFSIKIKKYKYLRWAFDYDVFIINEEIVFRFSRTEETKNKLRQEIKFLKFLKGKVKIRIPQYIYISHTSDCAGYPIIPGTILTPSAFNHLSKSNKEKVINQIISFINDFHKINLDEFDAFTPRKRVDFIESEKKIENKLQEKLFPKLSKQEGEVIKNFYHQSKKYLTDISHMCATHGDLYAYNILWDKKTLQVGIIDFTDILIGDPAKDFEVFYDYGVEFADLAYQKYEGVKDDTFLIRAHIYYKVHAIYTLLSSLCGALISFTYAHVRFRQKFRL